MCKKLIKCVQYEVSEDFNKNRFMEWNQNCAVICLYIVQECVLIEKWWIEIPTKKWRKSNTKAW